MVSAEPEPPYQRPPLSKELWFSDSDEGPQFKDWRGETRSIYYQPAYEGNVRLMLGREAVNLDPQQRRVTLDDGTVIGYQKVLLAMGGQPRMLEELQDITSSDRILTLRTLADFKRIRKVAKTAQHIAIIGGGFLGSEMAVALANQRNNDDDGSEEKLQVTQIFPEKGNMGLVFPPYLSSWTTDRVREEGVTVMPSCRLVTAKINNDGSKKKVSLELSCAGEAKKVNVDHVLVAVGMEPSGMDLARRAGLPVDEENGLMADETLAILPPHVYGAGDLISYPDGDLGMMRRTEHHEHALMSGRTAGQNMAASGIPQPHRHQSMFWSDLGPRISYEAVGMLDSSKLRTVGVWAKQDPVNSKFGKGLVLYLLDRKIVGVLLFNLPNRLGLARQLIQQGSAEDLESIVRQFNIDDDK